jgi:phosphoribosyl 1,2-cyclic phosphodiesterase
MAYIKFWGVRGSIPTPGPATVRYGGNTSCVELRDGDQLWILDAGSGIRDLGNALLKEKKPVQAKIFLTHTHWDHIQGFPFFTPAYIPGNEFTIHAARDTEMQLKDLIAGQMNPTYFPVELSDMGSILKYRELSEGSYKLDDLRLDTLYVNHPGNTLAYKFFLKSKTVIYISDNEPFEPALAENETEVLGEDGNRKFIEFLRAADILIHDAQYTPEEYAKHKTWGHSPYTYPVDIAGQAGIRHLVLFHHDPLHDDDFIDDMLEKTRLYALSRHIELRITAAREGLKIDL